MIQIVVRDPPGLLQRSAYIECTQNVLDMHLYTCRQTVILNTTSSSVNSSVNSSSSVTSVLIFILEEYCESIACQGIYVVGNFWSDFP